MCGMGPMQPVDFAFISQDTPQHNNQVELAFPYIDGKARAMMGETHITNAVLGELAI